MPTIARNVTGPFISLPFQTPSGHSLALSLAGTTFSAALECTLDIDSTDWVVIGPTFTTSVLYNAPVGPVKYRLNIASGTIVSVQYSSSLVQSQNLYNTFIGPDYSGAIATAQSTANSAQGAAFLAKNSVSNLLITTLATRAQADGPQFVDGSRWVWSAAGTANAGTVVAGVTGFWLREFSGSVINGRWFGAKGDGTTDDTVAIRAVLAQGRAAGLGTYFPTGTYGISGAIQYGSQAVSGDGAGTIFKNLTVNRTAAMFEPTSTGVTPSLSNFVLDQNSTVSDGASMCLSIQGTVNAVVDHVRFRNIQTMAVWCDSLTAFPTVSPRIEACILENSVGGGISLFGRFTDVQVIGCQFNEYSDDAIAMQNSGNGFPTGMLVVGNTFRGGTYRRVSGTSDPSGSTPHCILVFGGDNVTITGNIGVGSVASGIAVLPGNNIISPPFRRPQNVVITGNNMTQAGITAASTIGVPGAGIEVRGADGVLVTGNAVSGSRQDGIAITGSSDVTVGDNSCVANGTTGMAIVSSTGVVATGGTYARNGTGGSNQFGVLVDGNSALVSLIGVTVTDTRTTGKTQQYGVFVTAGSQVDVIDCALVGNSVSPLSAATGSFVASRGNRTQTGKILAQGRATILAANLGVNVIHNLNGTPNRVVLTGYNDPEGLTWVVVDANTVTIRRTVGQAYAMNVDYIFDMSN